MEETKVDAARPEHTGPASSKAAYVAIDGPVAAGKSAVGSRVAQRLGYRFVDTGAMYRALTWLALERGLDLHDEMALARLAEAVTIALHTDPRHPTGRISLDGVDVTDELRSTEVGAGVSLVSRVPAVRTAMVSRQRELAGEGHVVMAGRDIGTVVLPDAALKIYLDASSEERTARRHEELLATGRDVALHEVREELALRDSIDSGRDVSPLRPADDAVTIDTDNVPLEQVVERILELASCH